jgi:hypothetical protein
MLGVIASTAAVASAALQQSELQPAWHLLHATAEQTRSKSSCEPPSDIR